MSPHCLGYITGSWASSFDHRHLVKQDVSRAQFKPSLPILSYRYSESKTSCSAQSLLPTMVPGKNQNLEKKFFLVPSLCSFQPTELFPPHSSSINPVCQEDGMCAGLSLLGGEERTLGLKLQTQLVVQH